MLDYAKRINAPVAIRYPKNAVEQFELVPFNNQPWAILKEGERATLLAVGPNMLSLAKRVAEKVDGVGVIAARQIKPLCSEVLEKIKDTHVITLEENSVIGGFGAAVLRYYSQSDKLVKVDCLGVNDEFIPHGSIEKQMQLNGLTEKKIIDIIEGRDKA
jgi:1-deoxy-D-xylulose-5-phosphate synthase